MKCQEREAALLMLVHGEAKGFRSLGTHLHLLVCRRCRAKVNEFYGVSKSLAANLENPLLGARKLIRPLAASAAGLTIAVLLLLTTAAGIVLLVMQMSAAADHCPPPANNAPIKSVNNSQNDANCANLLSAAHDKKPVEKSSATP